jgi:2-iminobutanoate/2-iminopropanoate deaminase
MKRDTIRVEPLSSYLERWKAPTSAVTRHGDTIYEAAGSSLDKILKCNVYCTSGEYFAAVNEVYVRFFPTDWPARMFVVVGPWAGRFDIEIDCIAFV